MKRRSEVNGRGSWTFCSPASGMQSVRRQGTVVFRVSQYVSPFRPRQCVAIPLFVLQARGRRLPRPLRHHAHLHRHPLLLPRDLHRAVCRSGASHHLLKSLTNVQRFFLIIPTDKKKTYQYHVLCRSWVCQYLCQLLHRALLQHDHCLDHLLPRGLLHRPSALGRLQQ